jgi:hypothetical protein
MGYNTAPDESDQLLRQELLSLLSLSTYPASYLLAVAFAGVVHKSGVPYTDKNLPRHLTTNKV